MSEAFQLLNVGCGRHFHVAWRNIDVVSCDPAVEACDLRQGIPANDGQYDMVYHSHVLEHLSPELGSAFLRECFRVLKPGGLLRVVVPDLEQITRLYLQTLEEAWQVQPHADSGHSSERAAQADALSPAERLTLAKYEWMKLELLDQLVRQSSGGRMGPWMQAAEGPIAEWIASRLGGEVAYAVSGGASESPGDVLNAAGRVGASSPAAANAAKQRPVPRARKPWRERWARKLLKWCLGADAVGWLEVGKFLDSGEVHRWMYDRHSLRQLCQSVGFREFRLCRADESGLQGFADYQLDQTDGAVRKPDSLFAECRKPPSGT